MRGYVFAVILLTLAVALAAPQVTYINLYLKEISVFFSQFLRLNGITKNLKFK